MSNKSSSHLRLSVLTLSEYSKEDAYMGRGFQNYVYKDMRTAALIMSIFPIAWFALHIWKAPNGIPRGPWGVPVLGCLPFLSRYPERTPHRWAKKYGGLYSLWLGNQLVVVVSCPRIAKDLFIAAGSVFSSRKEFFIKGKTIMRLRGITASPYNDRWRKHRRIATTWLNQKAVDDYAAVIDRETADMIRCLLVACDSGKRLVNPLKPLGRCSLNCMLSVTFGTRAERMDDPHISEFLRLSREFMNLTGPMSNVIDYVPLLQKFPLKIRSRARLLHDDLKHCYGGMFNDMTNRLSSGVRVPGCLAKHVLAIRDRENLDDEDVSMLMSAFMIGGVETTASVMQWFSALIASYPEIQRRAHEELDKVVGKARLPSAKDEANLPYCRAIIKETERCRNPFWLGTPHFSMQDYTYQDHFIPKGTVIVCNTFSMHHGPTRYSAPDHFNPDRYFEDNLSSAQSANLADPMKRDHWAFGVGRRICPGIFVAEREVWLAISRMLWAFEFEAAPERPIDLNEYDGHSGRSPMPFVVRLRPRHEKVKEALRIAEGG